MFEVQRLSLTTLPQAIIETILCILPTEEAARTSILSREWRYKWTTIPKLEFDGSYVVKRSAKGMPLSDLEHARNKEIRCEYLNAIHQVLLLRQGPIHEFSLEIVAHDTSFEIDQIMLHLSKNHIVKKLTLTYIDLPSSVFSLPHLTDLYLNSCYINHKPIVNGFGSLTSLFLNEVRIFIEDLLHLLSNCPSLKSLTLLLLDDDLLDDESPGIMELFKCLIMIEHLTISGYFIKLLLQASVPKELPTSLIHLKYCVIEDMCLVDDYGFPFLCVLIKCSPNLEKIKLEINTFCCDIIKGKELYDSEFEGYSDSEVEVYSGSELEEYSINLEEYSDVWLEHLNEVEIKYFGSFKSELEFVKFILARSPSLKKVTLQTYMDNLKEDILKILSSAPRVSPVEIVVEEC